MTIQQLKSELNKIKPNLFDKYATDINQFIGLWHAEPISITLAPNDSPSHNKITFLGAGTINGKKKLIDRLLRLDEIKSNLFSNPFEKRISSLGKNADAYLKTQKVNLDELDTKEKKKISNLVFKSLKSTRKEYGSKDVFVAVATKIHSSKRDKLIEIAKAHNMTVNELMKNFIENLIDDEGGSK
jgi:hypothetical protein